MRFTPPIPDESQEPAEHPESHVPTLVDSLGGPWGMAEQSVPTVAFVIAFTASGSDTGLAARVAVVVALVLTVVRLARRESPRQALTGLLGVGIAAYFATKTGKAENFYLPGLLINVGYASAMLISIIVRWPLIGLIAGQFDGTGTDFREDPVRARLMAKATWLWVAMFTSRVAVQTPMYLAGSVVVLGIARTVMGMPLMALTAWVTYRWLRLVPDED